MEVHLWQQEWIKEEALSGVPGASSSGSSQMAHTESPMISVSIRNVLSFFNVHGLGHGDLFFHLKVF